MTSSDEAIKADSTGLRRLLTRRLPEATYHLRAVEPDVEAAARQEVADAEEELGRADLRFDDGGDAARTAAREVLAAARGRLAACYEPVVIRALPPAEYEALAAAHKDAGSESGLADDDLGHAAFVAGVQGDLEPEEWAAVLAQCSTGERTALLMAALALNIRATDGSVPKG